LWNPSSKELLRAEDDEAGRLAGFRARFGKGFDASLEDTPPAKGANRAKGPTFEEEKNDFAEDDMNLLDLISSFGQEGQQASNNTKADKGKGGKKK
jgi:hypothetical protein